MRTRASGPPSPPSSPPIPLLSARGTKRPSSADIYVDADDDDGTDELNDVDVQQHDVQEHSNPTGLLTPRKAKRVRFSEPVPNIQAHILNSTGLTPSFRRTRLLSDDDGTGALLKRKPTRLHGLHRATLPPSFEPSPPSTPIIQEIQYAPLRQILDDRMRRRLRRSHLSEELNTIEQQRREDHRERKELDQLRVQGQQNDARIKDLMFEIESQRQLNIQVGTDEEQHAEALREELERLRRDIANRDEVEEERRRIEGSPTEFDSDEDLWDDHIEPTSPLVDGFDTESSSPALGRSSPLPPSSPLAHAAVQTSMNTELSYHSHDLSEQLADAKRQASDARAALHLLHGELLALGFNDGTATTEQLVQSIKDAFRQARLYLEYHLPGETPGGFENVLLLPAMLDHVRKLLAKARESRKAAEVSEQSENVMRNHFNITVEKLEQAENAKTILLGHRQAVVAEVQRKERCIRDLELAANARAGFINERDQIIEDLESELKSVKEDASSKTERFDQLQQEARDQAVTVERLQHALGSYRTEVASLEKLVSTLEQDKSRAEYAAKSSGNTVASQQKWIDQLTQTLTDVTGYVEHHLGQLKHGSEQHHASHVKAFDDAKAFIEQQLSNLEG